MHVIGTISLCLTLCAINQRIALAPYYNVIAAATWTLWLDRNNMIFNENERSMLSSWKNICNFVEIWSNRYVFLKIIVTKHYLTES